MILRRFFPFSLAAIISACTKIRYGDSHQIPNYAAYSADSARLTPEEGLRFRTILESAVLVEDELYEKADLVVFCFFDTDLIKGDSYSLYLKNRLIYCGYWLDARTLAMQGSPVECLEITEKDARWIDSLRERK